MHLQSDSRWIDWLIAIIAPLIATIVSWFVQSYLPVASLSLLYLAAVLITAVSTSIRPALLSAIIGFLAYNFFFTAPHFTLFILHREDILTAFLLILVALITGHLAAGLREKLDALQQSQHWMQQQISITQTMSLCIKPDDVYVTFNHEMRKVFSDNELKIDLDDHYHTDESLSNKSGDIDIHWKDKKLTVTLIGNNHEYRLYQITLYSNSDTFLMTRLDSLIQILRLAWSRVVVMENLQHETVIKEREQLRSALLSSISHDLRTPLATMIGSVSSLCDIRPSLTEAQQEELLNNTLSEARRLDRYIQKLLDMTKIGQGELKLERDWVGLDDILSVSLKRLTPIQQGQKLSIQYDQDLPLLFVHAALLEQAFFNVLENAVRYTPGGKSICITVHSSDNNVFIDIADSGPGIPEQHWPQIFDMFFTLSQGDQQTGGTGLGLTICQGILAAHGGSARVLYSSALEGTCFRLTLPLQHFTGNFSDDTDSDY